MSRKAIKKDMAHIWHPYTHIKRQKPLLFTRGKGSYLFDVNNEKYLDAISSWWVNLHGHCHPYIAKAITKQTKILEHTIFTDFTHQGAITFAERLLKMLPGNFSRVFYSDNGSTAVEAALKMAIQFSQKKTIVVFKSGYHGDTFGSMSVSKGLFNTPFWPFLFSVTQIETPLNGNEDLSISQMKKALAKDDVIGFLYEPMIQGASGMRMYSHGAMCELLKLCIEKNVLLIADEVMTGFGRTGPLFASSYYPIKPDVITLSKGITGGFLPLGVTVCTEKIFKKVKMFLHGHSYTANPLSLSAALANLDLLEKDDCKAARKNIEESHQAFAKKSPVPTRYLGTILAVEYGKSASYFSPLKEKIKRYFLKQKIIVRPLGNVLYIMPPYCIKKSELEYIYETIVNFDH